MVDIDTIVRECNVKLANITTHIESFGEEKLTKDQPTRVQAMYMDILYGLEDGLSRSELKRLNDVISRTISGSAAIIKELRTVDE